MRYRNLGSSGLRVSIVGLGCNNFGSRIGIDEARAVTHKAFDLGVNFFDTADYYGKQGGSEEALGTILGSARKDVLVASKFGLPMGDGELHRGASRRYIYTAIDASLRRLKTDWIDLYLLHVPDPLTPILETLAALNDLVTAGKVRYIGCSNLAGWQVVEAQWAAKSAGLTSSFVACQDEYNLINHVVERELIPVTKQYGMGLIPYSPLAGGLLSGKYARDREMPAGARLTNDRELAKQILTDRNWMAVEKMNQWAAKRGLSLLELSMAWLVTGQQVSTVIAGATTAFQVEENVRAVGINLSPEDMKDLDNMIKMV